MSALPAGIFVGNELKIQEKLEVRGDRLYRTSG
jgi:hypothetical protein